MSITFDFNPDNKETAHFDSQVEAITYACAKFNLALKNYSSGINILFKGKIDSQEGSRRGIQLWLYAKKGSLFMNRIVIYETGDKAGGLSYDVESSVILGK